MKIKRIQYTPSIFTLNQRFSNAKMQYFSKEIILIEIITGSASGYGEISPLEKFSTETAQEIQWGLQAFIQSIDYNVDYSLNNLLRQYNDMINPNGPLLVDVYPNFSKQLQKWSH